MYNPKKHLNMEQKMELIRKLAECAAACEYCMDSCLSEDDVKMMVNCIRTDRDCARICTMVAGLVASNSPLALRLLPECEHMCIVCAEECERHDMDHCRECAKVCRECAEVCHQYANVEVGH
jgi:hypothetical protein